MGEGDTKNFVMGLNMVTYAALLPPLYNFMKYFEYFGLLFLWYQSKGIDKKHQKRFEHIEITIISSKKAGY